MRGFVFAVLVILAILAALHGFIILAIVLVAAAFLFAS